MPDITDERRMAVRLKDGNEINVTILPEQKPVNCFFSSSEDISVSGARICADIFLPVDTFLMIKMKLKSMHQMITCLGQVMWSKNIPDDETYEAGVEFLAPPRDVIKEIANYVSEKQKLSISYPD
jgi:hypothetical protein